MVIDERLTDILVDSFGKILLPGLRMTIPLTAISFSLPLIIAVVVALVQFAGIKGLKQLARFYIWVIRGTPLLIQLYIIFYGLPKMGIVIDPFPAGRSICTLRPGRHRYCVLCAGSLQPANAGNNIIR